MGCRTQDTSNGGSWNLQFAPLQIHVRVNARARERRKNLRIYFHVASSAEENWAMLGIEAPKAVRDCVNNYRIAGAVQRHIRDADLAADRAAQLLVPLVLHRTANGGWHTHSRPSDRLRPFAGDGMCSLCQCRVNSAPESRRLT